jgi:hypothetical protein
MPKRFALVVIGTALAAMPCRPAAAQNECANGGYYLAVPQNEYSNGGYCKKNRGPAILTPVEAFGVHPPGPDPADQHRWVFCWWKYTYVPYYSPIAPIATSIRWKPWCYFPLLPYYTPYYIGYCPKRLHCPKPPPYGYDGGWGQGPAPDHPIPDVTDTAPLRYGPYTSVIADDTTFWNMGGNGLVPYGTPRPPHSGPPDLVDAIQITRQQGGGGCALAPNGGVPVTTGPAILPPAEKVEGGENNEAPAAQTPPPPPQ